jgi:Ser/Thr protein kinase RdoA (MazF antagonist)
VSIPALAHWAARQFTRTASPPELVPLGRGLINDTFKVTGSAGDCFVLQRLNSRVLPNPAAILANYRVLLAHRRNLPQSRRHLRIPHLRLTLNGQDHLIDEAGHLWRALQYLAETRSLARLTTPQQARAVGTGLGRFHALFADLATDCLQDTLPGFHVTPRYLEHYDAVCRQVASTTAELEQAMVQAEAGRSRAAVLEAARLRGDLRERVTHGDPKLDNLLFDQACSRVVSLIDLDTVKAGLPHYDLGDCVRSCCGRNEQGVPAFDLSLCIPLLQAYHAQSLCFTTPGERHYWYDAIRLIPYELGLRFLTDHLAGNIYFKVTHPDQNLHRALAQFRIADSVEQQKEPLLGALAQLERQV